MEDQNIDFEQIMKEKHLAKSHEIRSNFETIYGEHLDECAKNNVLPADKTDALHSFLIDSLANVMVVVEYQNSVLDDHSNCLKCICPKKITG